MAESHDLVSDPRLYILLVALSSAVLVVTLYHCAVICCYNRNPQPRQTRRRLRPETTGLTDGSMGPSSASELIPARKYQRDVGLVLVGDGMCAVCISDFEEGEEFRTLPECMHSFHVSCIDMWLFSHSSCPICRADATLSSLVVRCLPDLESGNVESR